MPSLSLSSSFISSLCMYIIPSMLTHDVYNRTKCGLGGENDSATPSPSALSLQLCVPFSERWCESVNIALMLGINIRLSLFNINHINKALEAKGDGLTDMLPPLSFFSFPFFSFHLLALCSFWPCCLLDTSVAFSVMEEGITWWFT